MIYEYSPCLVKQDTARINQPKSTNFQLKRDLTWADLQRWEVHSLQGVVSELEAIFHGRSFKCTGDIYCSTVSQLRLQAINAAQKAHEYRQDYAHCRPLTNWRT